MAKIKKILEDIFGPLREIGSSIGSIKAQMSNIDVQIKSIEKEEEEKRKKEKIKQQDALNREKLNKERIEQANRENQQGTGTVVKTS